MAARPEKAGKEPAIHAEEKIARLLGLLLVKGVEQQRDQVLLLRAAGFQTAEVAAMLRTTENYVSVTEYQERKKTKKKRK